MTPSSPLSTCMCKFHLKGGLIKEEVDFADPDGQHGWRNFPYKRDVEGVEMADRIVNAAMVKMPKEIVKGFAIHWVGAAAPGINSPYSTREIMIVTKKLIVFVSSYNVIKNEWHDYIDNLKRPDKPHLSGYKLSVHGM